MSPDDMARELRAAGWDPCPRHPQRWTREYDPFDTCWRVEHAWKELAQQRERGTVQTPVVGTEEK